MRSNIGEKLIKAVGENRRKQLKELLGARTIVVDYRDHEGTSALWYASAEGHEVAVRMLIEAKATVDLLTNGCTSLYVACQEGHVKCAQLLLKAKASVSFAMDGGTTPLWAACQNGHSKCVRLLLKAKASVDAAEMQKSTPLHMACQNGHSKCVRTSAGAVALALASTSNCTAGRGSCIEFRRTLGLYQRG